MASLQEWRWSHIRRQTNPALDFIAKIKPCTVFIYFFEARIPFAVKLINGAQLS